MKFPVDSYDIKARLAPALLLILPALITFWTYFSPEIEKITKVFSGIMSVVIYYALSVIVRHLGKKVEPSLWESWGGAPSTIIVSWKDNSIGNDLKAKYHKMISQDQDLPMPTKEEELADPEVAMRQIDQAFERVKGVIRKEDKDGLWSIANSEYGFARNLYGSKWVWLIIILAMIATSAFFLWAAYSRVILLGFILNFIILIGSIILEWIVLPKLTKQIGFRYAAHAWESYCNIIEERLKIT